MTTRQRLARLLPLVLAATLLSAAPAHAEPATSPLVAAPVAADLAAAPQPAYLASNNAVPGQALPMIPPPGPTCVARYERVDEVTSIHTFTLNFSGVPFWLDALVEAEWTIHQEALDAFVVSDLATSHGTVERDVVEFSSGTADSARWVAHGSVSTQNLMTFTYEVHHADVGGLLTAGFTIHYDNPHAFVPFFNNCVIVQYIPRSTLTLAPAPSPADLVCEVELVAGVEYSAYTFTLTNHGVTAFRNLFPMWTVHQGALDAFTISEPTVSQGRARTFGSAGAAVAFNDGTGDSGRWQVGNLEPGQSATLTYTVYHADTTGFLTAQLHRGFAPRDAGGAPLIGSWDGCVITQYFPASAPTPTPTDAPLPDLTCTPDFTPGRETSQHQFTVTNRGQVAVSVNARWAITQGALNAFSIENLTVSVGSVGERGEGLPTGGTIDSGTWQDLILAPDQYATFTYTVNHAGPGGPIVAQLNNPQYWGLCVISHNVEAQLTNIPTPSPTSMIPTPDAPSPTPVPTNTGRTTLVCEADYEWVDSDTSIHTFTVTNEGSASLPKHAFWIVHQPEVSDAFTISNPVRSGGFLDDPNRAPEVGRSWGWSISPGERVTFSYTVHHSDAGGVLYASLGFMSFFGSEGSCGFGQNIPGSTPSSSPIPTPIPSPGIPTPIPSPGTPTPSDSPSPALSPVPSPTHTGRTTLVCETGYEWVDSETSIHTFTVTNEGRASLPKQADWIMLQPGASDAFTISNPVRSGGSLNDPNRLPEIGGSWGWWISPGERVTFSYTVHHSDAGGRLYASLRFTSLFGSEGSCWITQNIPGSTPSSSPGVPTPAPSPIPTGIPTPIPSPGIPTPIPSPGTPLPTDGPTDAPAPLACVAEYERIDSETSVHTFTLTNTGSTHRLVEAGWRISQVAAGDACHAFHISNPRVSSGLMPGATPWPVCGSSTTDAGWGVTVAPGEPVTFSYTVMHYAPNGPLRAQLASRYWDDCTLMQDFPEVRPSTSPSVTPPIPSPGMPTEYPTGIPTPIPSPTDGPISSWSCVPAFEMVDAITSIHSFTVANTGDTSQTVDALWTIGQAIRNGGPAFTVNDVRVSTGNAPTLISPFSMFTAYSAQWSGLTLVPGAYVILTYTVIHVDPYGILRAGLSSDYWGNCSIAHAVPAMPNGPTPSPTWGVPTSSPAPTPGLTCVAGYESLNWETSVHTFTLTNNSDTYKSVNTSQWIISQASDPGGGAFALSDLHTESGVLTYPPTHTPPWNTTFRMMLWNDVTIAPGESVIFSYTLAHNPWRFSQGQAILNARLTSAYWDDCAIRQYLLPFPSATCAGEYERINETTSIHTFTVTNTGSNTYRSFGVGWTDNPSLNVNRRWPSVTPEFTISDMTVSVGFPASTASSALWRDFKLAPGETATLSYTLIIPADQSGMVVAGLRVLWNYCLIEQYFPAP